jgi:hypothetical protein
MRVVRVWRSRTKCFTFGIDSNTKVARGSDYLYVLHAEVTQPLCLAARRDDEA